MKEQRSQYSLFLNEFTFQALLVVLIIMMYWNAREGAFIWDDRAAIISNKDVTGLNPISELFSHDFWGQDITLMDSHKSYRPFTVLTFRMDHTIYGLNAYGYHTTNIIIYILACLSVYQLFLLWLNRPASRVAAMIFATHPVHVEAVTSLVGRADCLCGLFYSLCIYCYYLAVTVSFPASSQMRWKTKWYFPLLGLSMICGWISSLSKEVGVTVFPILGVIDLIQHLKSQIISNKSFKVIRYRNLTSQLVITSEGKEAEDELHDQNDEWIEVYRPRKPNLFHNIQLIITSLRQIFTSFTYLVRIGLLLLMVFLFFQFRISLHGETTVYHWTIMENHINGISNPLIRILSYGQSHFWYFYKLIYPKYLCFDYGYFCIPVIYQFIDLRNILPFIAYLSFFSCVVVAIRELRFSLFLGIAIFLFPLIPALNIFIPVGTLLAERLLFVPSIGFSMIIGELLVYDCSRIWKNMDHFIDEKLQEIEGKIDHNLEEIRNYLNSHVSDHHHHEDEMNDEDKGNKESDHNHGNGLSPKKNVRFHFPNSGKKSDKKKKPSHSPKSKAATPGDGTSNADTNQEQKHLSFRIKFPLIILFLFPFLWDSTHRIIRRNIDWKTELNIYSSALEVCPYSVKALANYAMLVSGKSTDYEKSLQAAMKSILLYAENAAGAINAGVAYQRLHQLLPSLELFEYSSQFENTAGKSMGYIGSTLYLWLNDIQDPIYKAYIRALCLSWIDAGLYVGFGPPAILHIGGSVAFDQKNFPLAIDYYQTAVKFTLENQALRKGSSDVPIEDDVNLAFTYNQIGNCYYNLNNYSEAIKYYEMGLAIQPNSLPLLANAGIVYREVKDYLKAKEVSYRGLQLDLTRPSPALLNNLGTIEKELNNYEQAYKLFQQAYQIVQENKELKNRNYVVKEQGVDLRYDGGDEGSVEEVIYTNLIDAQSRLHAAGIAIPSS